LIARDAKGVFRVKDKLLTTGKDVQNLAVQHYHAENLKLAENALKALPRDKRNISGLTLGISRDSYQKVCDMIYEMQDKILDLAEKDKKADSVYQLNFQLFPVSKISPNGGAK
jgi:uncharacterized protein (TIGR02147 family)